MSWWRSDAECRPATHRDSAGTGENPAFFGGIFFGILKQVKPLSHFNSSNCAF